MGHASYIPEVGHELALLLERPSPQVALRLGTTSDDFVLTSLHGAFRVVDGRAMPTSDPSDVCTWIASSLRAGPPLAELDALSDRLGLARL